MEVYYVIFSDYKIPKEYTDKYKLTSKDKRDFIFLV